MNETPRILMISRVSYPLAGGAEKQGELLAQTLHAMGVKVAKVAARLPGMPAYEVRNGVQFYRLPCAPWRKYFRYYVAATVYQVSLTAFLLRAGKQFDIFHLHGHFDVSVGPVITVARQLRKVSLVKQSSMHHSYPIGGLLGRLMEPIARWPDAYVGNSPPVYDMLLHKHKVPLERCYYIPNGVVVDAPRDKQEVRAELGLGAGEPIAVCVATINKLKNQISAIHAWSRVVERFPTARILFIGAETKPKLAEYYRAEAQRLGLSNHVLILGWKSHVNDYLDAADVFVLASRTEGMSNSVLEAMAHGIPCVVSDVPGNRFLISGEPEGLLFAPDNHEALACAVLRVLTDPILARRLGVAARAKIEAQFTMERVAARYLRFYRYLLHGGDSSDFRPAMSL